MSGGRPPTNTLRENLSVTSEPCEFGDDLAGEPIGMVAPSTKPPASSVMWSSNPWKNGLPEIKKNKCR